MGGGLQEFRMFDVGGQRDQRNKWIQVFEGIEAVLFVISCGDFDQTLREDPTQNRLTEAVRLFSGVWHNRFLASAGIIVFLNKQDIMERKIQAGKSIGQYFPEYEEYKRLSKGGNFFDESDRTKHFIKQKLVVRKYASYLSYYLMIVSQRRSSTQLHFRKCFYFLENKC